MTAPSAHHSRIHQDPAFGWDPWLNSTTDPRKVHAEYEALAKAGKLYHGEDTIGGDIGLLTPSLDVYFSYVDNLGGYSELEQRFPHANKEQGLPWGYTNAANMQSLVNVAGGRKFIRESAHFGFGMHICGPRTCGYAQADWTQWDDHGVHGENVDRVVGSFMPAPGPLLVSITVNPPGHRALFADVEPGGMTLSEFAPWYDHVAIKNPVPAPDPHQYWRYENVKRFGGGLTERVTVKEYDKWRAMQTFHSHPHRARLGVLRAHCVLFAARIHTLERLQHDPAGNKFDRKFRSAGLTARARGKRV